MLESIALGCAWKATLVLGIAFLVVQGLRGASSAARHVVWVSALVCALLLPVLERTLPSWNPPVLAQGPAETLVVRPAVEPLAASAGARRIDWRVMIWACGLVAVVARLGAGVWQLRALARGAAPFRTADVDRLARQLRLRRPVLVRVTAEAGTPMTWGVWRPVILLPAGAASWTGERMRLVLAHELMHVARLDWLTQVLAQVACAVYWFHPLVWLAAREMRRERERASDDGVLALGAEPSVYAGHLLGLARSSWTVAVAMAQPSHLESRLVAILDGRVNRRPVTGRTAGVALFGAMVLTASLATLRASPQTGAGLFGIVRDASGGTIPQATVTISSPQPARKEITYTNDAGEYSFPGLPAGAYVLEVRKRGFKVFTQSGVAVPMSEPARADVTMEIGAVSETINVVGTPPSPRPAPAGIGTPRRIRVGGDVQATRLVYQVKPVYPEPALRNGIEGTVLLQAVISKEGGLLGIRAVNTLVSPDLVDAAMDAVKQWRYAPTLLNGEPVEVVTTVTVNFRLAP